MTRKLTPGEIERYRRDNFLSPVLGITAAEAAHYRTCLERFEATLGPGPVESKYRRKTHVLLPWVHGIVTQPAVLDAVEDLIGPDILVFNATWFIKEPRTDAITAWHQDATYFGLTPYEHVSAWIALSPATRASGCMEMLPGSSGWGQLHHAPQILPNSINAGAQAIVEPLDTSRVAFTPLESGQFSLHHTLVVHQSQPNGSDDRRIGLGISYIPTGVRHTGSMRMPAMLVRGEDRHGHFDLEPIPVVGREAEAQAAHGDSYRRYRAGYNEQVERHRVHFQGPAMAAGED
ncbi:MAG: phytanoyl-CoA dioxygenase family protein [Alphaproteobacteria bacterium]|nr:phytanoyl-CoA dioxygenase family protein [Alphaproteobacteria bacterium]